jgi:hypothetical protein
MSKRSPVQSKAERKTAASAAGNKSAFETTAFGRRRVSRFVKTYAYLARIAGLLCLPFFFAGRQLGRFKARLRRINGPAHTPAPKA